MRGCPVTVGRVEELERLRSALEPDGDVAVVVVSGEAGIGKSRLVGEALRSLDDGAVSIRRGACHLADQVLPFGPFIDMAASAGAASTSSSSSVLAEVLTDVLGGAADDGDAGDQTELHRRRVLDEIADALLEPVGTTIVVVEDVHWADDVSLQALGHLARRIATSPHRLILTLRPREGSAELSSQLAEMARRRIVEEIELRALDAEAIASMAEAMTGSVPTLEQRAGLGELSDGNPFHIEELLRSSDGTLDAIDASVPRPIEHSIVSRLAALDPVARRAACRAAVIGRDVPVGQLSELMGWSEPETARYAGVLVEAGLLRDVSGDRLRFVHELARRSVESQLLTMERVAVHREITAHLAGRVGRDVARIDDRTRADLARHAYEGQGWSAAIEHGEVAARDALGRWSARAAITHLDRVIDAGAQGNIAIGPGVHVLRARARRHVGELGTARDDLATAIASADATDDRAHAWEARFELAMIDSQESHERAAASLDDALAAAEEWGDPVAIARTLNRQGNITANRLEFDEALRLLEEAMRLAVDAGDDRVIAETALLSMVTNSLRGDLISARRHGVDAVERLRRLDDPVELVNALFSLSMTGGEHFSELSQPSAPLAVCAAEAAEALELATALDWTAGRALGSRALGSIRSAEGRAAEAVALLRESIELAESAGHLTHILRGNAVMGEVLLDTGDSVGARRHLETAIEVSRRLGAAAAALPSQLRLVEVDVAEGRIDDGTEGLDRIIATIPESVRRSGAGARAELLLAGGRAKEALAVVEAAIEDSPGADEGADPPVRLALLGGRALAELGRHDEAGEMLRRADLCAREQGMRLMLRNIVAARARVCAMAGDRERARVLCDEAWELVGEAGEGLDDELVQLLRADMERRTSSLPRGNAGASGGVGSLTKRELEVAQVLARGLTNQQIADELFISVRTVETHVKRILSKLGVRSRGQVARWVLDQRPDEP